MEEKNENISSDVELVMPFTNNRSDKSDGYVTATVNEVMSKSGADLDLTEEIKSTAEFVKSAAKDEIDYAKYMKNFVFPPHSKNCKKCYGRMFVGYTYDPSVKETDENGERKHGKKVVCPKYATEVEYALRLHVMKQISKERGAIRAAENKRLRAAKSFDDMTKGSLIVQEEKTAEEAVA